MNAPSTGPTVSPSSHPTALALTRSAVEPSLVLFCCRSDKEAWQKERETFAELKNKLEEQREVDNVRVQEFNVSRTDEH